MTTFAYTANTVTATTNGRYVKTTVDGFGRTTLTETDYGTTAVSIVENQYEPCGCTPIGKLSKTSRPYAPGASTKYWTTYTYDQLGRTVSVVAPDAASTTSYLYQGNTVKTTDAAGKWKLFTQDAVGNLVQVNEPNPAGGSDYVTTYTYDAFDHLGGVSMPRPTGTQTRTFVYGGDGQMSSKTEPETGTTTFNYNTDATLNYKLDAKGQKTVMVYDGSKRVTQIQKLPDGVNEDLCQRVEMFYDGNYPTDGDAGVTSYGNGRLSAVRYRGGTNCTAVGGHTYVEQYSYTQYGAMTTKHLKVMRNVVGGSGLASGVLESTAEYDGEGRMLAVTYPITGKRYQYGYDSRGFPNTLTNTTDATTIVSSVTYGLAGEMTGFGTGGGRESRTYNANGQMTGMTLPGRTITYNFPAAGSNNGQVASVVDSGETITYLYDSLKRLTSATGSGWSQTFAYDGFGNLYNKVGTGTAPSWGATIDPATNRISGYSFDANGNQTWAPMTSGMTDYFSFSYDVSNRMLSAENPTATRRTDYQYDAGNKRIYERRFNGGTSEWFYFFGITGQRMARYNFTIAGSVITFTQDEASIWFGGKLVQKVNTFGFTWANADRLGSVGKYLPYGEDKPGASNPSNDNEKFATYTRDANTGIDYAGQRWQAQGTGRFLTGDTFEVRAKHVSPGMWNRYGYAASDPVTYIDVDGDEPTEPADLGSPLYLSLLWGQIQSEKILHASFRPGNEASPENVARWEFKASTLEARSWATDALRSVTTACKTQLQNANLWNGLSASAGTIKGLSLSDSVSQYLSIGETVGAVYSSKDGTRYDPTLPLSVYLAGENVYQDRGGMTPDGTMILGLGFFDNAYTAAGDFNRMSLALHELLHLAAYQAGTDGSHLALAGLLGINVPTEIPGSIPPLTISAADRDALAGGAINNFVSGCLIK